MFPRSSWHRVALLSLVGLAGCGPLTGAPPSASHPGIANASAVAMLDARHMAVASDESNVLLVYAVDDETPASARLDLSQHAGVYGKSLEIDLEGGARVGDRIYWIGSHGRNKDGKPRPNRQRLMATKVVVDDGKARLVPEGRPYSNLLNELLADPRYEPLGLRRAAANPPEQNGINIEGLGATAEGGLLIGFRSPLVDGKALLVPLLNPAEVVEGGRAKLGDPILVDLGGLGVRDLVWSGKEHFIIGGGVKGAAKARLFRWAGGKAEEVKGTGFKHFNPEALTTVGTGSEAELLVLSDDGNRQKSQAEPAFRSFRVRPSAGE